MDGALRRAERDSVGGGIAAQARLLRQRVRSGDLKRHYVKYAAALGDEVARMIREGDHDLILVECECKRTNGMRAGRVCQYCGGRTLREWDLVLDDGLRGFITKVAIPIEILIPYAIACVAHHKDAETQGVIRRCQEVLEGGEIPAILAERAFRRNGRWDALGCLAEIVINRKDTQRHPEFRRMVWRVVSRGYDGTRACRDRQIQMLIDQLLA